MKKTILTIAIALGASSMFAQNLVSKKGEAYLPVQGEWGLGIDATPLFNYFGNFFGKTANNTAPTWTYLTGNNAITGKYFLEDDLAIRGGLRLGFWGDKEKNQVIDRTSTTAAVYPNLPNLVNNEWKNSGYNIGLSGGLEWRKGSTRLQGFYGGEFGIGFSGSKDKYTYGNQLDPKATPAVLVDAADALNGGANIGADTYGNVSRSLIDKAGTTISVGLRAFVGVEYFILPKISLAGEFGWGLVFAATGESSHKAESTDVPAGSTDPVVGVQEIKGGKTTSFGIDNQLNNQLFGAAGKISVNFYF